MMTINLRVVSILVLAATAVSMAQTTTRSADGAKTSDDAKPIRGRPSLESEMEELRQKIESQQSQINLQQSQINALRQQLSDRGVESQQHQTLSGSNQQQNIDAVATLEGAVSEIRTPAPHLVQKAQTSQGPQTSDEGPDAIRYKGVSIVPGGFLAGESIWRQASHEC
jgi:TolA-binding protein